MKNFKINLFDPDKIINSKESKIVLDYIDYLRIKNIGWHYIVDLIFIYSKIKGLPKGSTILDAGGGGGVLQYFLAEIGYNVINIDYFHNPENVSIKNQIYDIKFTSLKNVKTDRYFEHLKRNYHQNFNLVKKLKGLCKIYLMKFLLLNFRKKNDIKVKRGKIHWIKGNLTSISDIQDNSFDAIVSLSAIEHIPKNNLNKVLGELTRVANKNAHFAITTSLSLTGRLYSHKPSESIAYGFDELSSFFGVKIDKSVDLLKIKSKWDKCTFLKNKLAPFYFLSDKNGMPLGVWDVKYLPVGIYR